jgi:MoaA/NifB/PqqE/SkfB family radical SAM enzyme
MQISLQKAISLFERATISDRPYHVQWFLTQRCNYRCKGCDVRRNIKTEELSAEEIKKGLDILRKLGTIEIVFSGGNPLLKEDIDEIIEYASKHFLTTIYDNGSMALEKIDTLRKADFVAISLDSLDEGKNDYIKGVSGAWKKAMEAVKELHSEGIFVGVSPTISQFNIDEIVDFTKYFIGLGIPVWYCLYWYDQPESDQLFKIGKKVNEFEIVDKEEFVKACDSLLALKRKYKGVFITEKTFEALKQLFLYGKRIWKCKALQSFFMIDPLGKVAGCHLKEPIASIFELPEVWDNVKLKELRVQNENCTKCAYLCYIFYSLHSDMKSNMEILFDQWKNIRLLASNYLRSRNM